MAAMGVSFNLEGNAKSFTGAVAESRSALKRLGGSFGTLLKSILQLNTYTLGFIATLKLFDKIKSAVNSFGELEEGLLKIQAVTGSTDAEMVGLRKQIEDLGFSTKFTTEDISKAFFNLGTMGLKGEAAFKQITPAVVDAAVALDVDLNTAAELVLSTLKVFNNDLSHARRVTDALTNAYTNSALNAEKYAVAQQYVGLTASIFKRQLEDILPLLMVTSDMQIDASMAGAALRTSFLGLLNPDAKAQEGLARLGLTLGDVNVETYGFIGVLENLKKAQMGTTEAVMLFDSRGGPLIQKLIEYSSEGKNSIEVLRNFEKIVRTSGTSAQHSAMRQKGLKFAFDQAKAGAGMLSSTIGELLNKLFGIEQFATKTAAKLAVLAEMLKKIDFTVLKEAGIRIFEPTAIAQNLRVAFDEVLPAFMNFTKEAFGFGAVWFGEKFAANFPTLAEFMLNIVSHGFIRLVGAGARLFVDIFAGGIKYAVTGLASFFNQIIASMLIAFGRMISSIPGLGEKGAAITAEGQFRRGVTREQFEQDPYIGKMLDFTGRVRDEANALIVDMENTAIDAVTKSTRAIKDAIIPAFDDIRKYYETEKSKYNVSKAASDLSQAASGVLTPGQRAAVQTVIDNRNQTHHNYREQNRTKMVADKAQTVTPKGDKE